MKRTMIGLMLMMASVTALADNPQWYGFAGIGQARIDPGSSGFWAAQDTKDTAWNAGVGLQLNKVVALEAGYYDMGTYGAQGAGDLPAGILTPARPASHVTGSTEGHIHGVGLSAKLGYPVGSFYPYVRLGTFLDATKHDEHLVDTVDGAFTYSHNNNYAARGMWGVGVGYKYVTLDFLQVQDVSLWEKSDVKQVTIGLRVPFGH